MEGENAKRLLERLTRVDAFEKFLHKTFLGQKRFSVEGNDMVVPMLNRIIRSAADVGTPVVTLGMAHRGRLNVLAHVMDKPYSKIFGEFQQPEKGEQSSAAGRPGDAWVGDVKYHLGVRGFQLADEEADEEVFIHLAPNPSHLEHVNPVVEGMARASQEELDEAGPPQQDVDASLPILLHGDAAFPGEGVSAETLNLSRLPGYRTGGTIHIITNNQLGFTTERQDARSTTYASDLAKGFEIPVVHVNADDPEACMAAARMAYAYREKFNKDFMIDLVGYRRFGHNEGDEPAYTQPVMYETIRDHPTVREIWLGSSNAAASWRRARQRLCSRRSCPTWPRSKRSPLTNSRKKTSPRTSCTRRSSDPRDGRRGREALRAERGPSRGPRGLYAELQARAPLPEEPRRSGLHRLGARRGAGLRRAARGRHPRPPHGAGHGARDLLPAPRRAL